MNPFLQSREQRSAAWKQTRAEVHAAQSVEHKIDICLIFWRQASIQNRLLDWDNCHTWPNPWELIYNNNYCPSSTSLGIAYTLLLGDPATFDDLVLKLITDRANCVQKIVCSTHGYCLNHGFVDRIPNNSLKETLTHSRWKWTNNKWQAG